MADETKGLTPERMDRAVEALAEEIDSYHWIGEEYVTDLKDALTMARAYRAMMREGPICNMDRDWRVFFTTKRAHYWDQYAPEDAPHRDLYAHPPKGSDNG
ncbi:MAG: hypothetical protein EA398_16195 [Deltaproteobacteria bacterium]|nr:MAG: hypothetical protein EA398_16195 [Deltaproteobacteria bacterium]